MSKPTSDEFGDVGPTDLEGGPDEFESEEQPIAHPTPSNSEDAESRRLSLTEKAAQRAAKAGGTHLVLCVTSFLIMVNACRQLSNIKEKYKNQANQPSLGAYKYAVAVGTTSFVLTFLMVLQNRLGHSAAMPKKAKLATSTFFFGWWLAAIVFLSFGLFDKNSNPDLDSSYSELSTAYMALWASGLISIVMLEEDLAPFKSAIQRMEKRASDTGPVFFLVVFSLVVVVEAITPANTSAMLSYGIAAGCIGAFTGVVLLVAGQRIDGRMKQGISIFSGLWFIVAIIVLTTSPSKESNGSFTSAGNGFFALYGSLFASFRMVGAHYENE